MPGNEATSLGPILVVDDEKFFRDLMSNILVEEGYEVQVVGTGEEAIAACAGGKHRVVVMDLVLPDIIGTEVLARIREDDPDIAVIMVTAYASMESAIDALKGGAYDYIKKPIVKEDLLHSVQRALEKQYLKVRNVQLVRQLESRIEEMKMMSREKEEVFRILDEGLVIIEDNGRIFDLNPTAAMLLGGGSSPMSGTDFFDTGFPLPQGFMTSVQAAGGQAVRSLVQYTGPDEQAREIELVGLSMAGNTGSPRVLLGLRDLTGIRELERGREEFLAIVSHDLRTPLTSLKGFIEVLLNGDYDSQERLQEYLGIIDSEADRMIYLINDLLDLGRLESGRMTLQTEPFSVVELINYAMKTMEGLASRTGVALQLDPVGDGPFIVDADRRRFLQVMVNLYSNAINFSPEGGTVQTVLSRMNGQIRIEVLDEGPGVPPEDQERIFDKYHQARGGSSERGKGSGLGLAIVRKIVDLHGGSIDLQDREGRTGSRFVIRLKTASREEG